MLGIHHSACPQNFPKVKDPEVWPWNIVIIRRFCGHTKGIIP